MPGNVWALQLKKKILTVSGLLGHSPTGSFGDNDEGHQSDVGRTSAKELTMKYDKNRDLSQKN